MLNTKSIALTGHETFQEAFAMMPENHNRKIRWLRDEFGQETGVYQISTDSGNNWMYPKAAKKNKDGSFAPINLDTKQKLEHANLFYDIYTKPTLVGGDSKYSWLIGDIDGCKILDDEYSVQGLLISTIFDPMPKFYISLERLVCENQFGALGRNSSSMYINMNEFLAQYNSDEARIKLTGLIGDEVNKRVTEAETVYNKLIAVKLSDRKIKTMFEKLTVDTVSKENVEAYRVQEERYAQYVNVYNCEDNQNFKRTLFGFVNSCTNINTRVKETPLDVIKPALPASVINNPVNFEYLCRAAVEHAA